jgi:hypothetical protein
MFPTVFRKPLAKKADRDSPWLAEMVARQQVSREYATRIERAMGDAGFDSNMLNDLPATYVAAALVLGVK